MSFDLEEESVENIIDRSLGALSDSGGYDTSFMDEMDDEGNEPNDTPQDNTNDDGNGENQPRVKNTSGDGHDDDGDDAPAANGVYDKLQAQLAAYGLDYDISEHKDKEITTEQARKIFLEAAKYESIKAIDPAAAIAMKHGIDVNAFRQEYHDIQQNLQMDNINLAKQQMFNKVWTDEYEMGQLPANDNGEIDKQKATDHVVAIVEAKAKKVEGKLDGWGANIRNQMTNRMNELPKQMQQAQDKERKASIDKYHTQIDGIIKSKDVSGAIDSGAGIPYASKGERDEFAKYVKEQLSYPEGKNSTVVMEKLNDSVTMVKVLRALYAMEKGTINKIIKTKQSQAFDTLDEFVDSKGTGRGQSTSRVRDTSKPRK